MSENVLADVDFSAEDVDQASKRAVLNNGWYQFIVQDAEGVEDEQTGDQFINMNCAPLEQENNIGSKTTPTLFNRLQIPFPNKSKNANGELRFPGHKVKNADRIAWRWLNFIREVIDPSVPDYPRTVSGVLTYNGREIPKENYEAAKKEVNNLVFGRIKQICKDPGTLINQAFYAEVFENGDYTNMRNISGSLPEGAKLVAPENFRTFRS